MNSADGAQVGLGLPTELDAAIADGIRRIEDLATGRVEGLTEEQYQAALNKHLLPPRGF